MSVAIIGASGVIGRAAVRAFARVDPDVRAVVRRAGVADELRSAGAKVAVGDLEEDQVALTASLSGADSVCHLVGGVLLDDDEAYERAIVGSVGTVVTAAGRAGVRRLTFVSAIGADPSSPNAYLRAKGIAEQAVRGSGLEFAIIRTAAVYGVGGPWFELLVAGAARRPPAVVGDPSTTVAPVFAGDVAAVLLAADDRADPVHGTWALEGPDRVAVGDLVAALSENEAPPRIVPADAAEVERLLRRPVSAAAVEVLTDSWRADAPDAAAEFGVKRTPLAEGIRRIASVARLEG